MSSPAQIIHQLLADLGLCGVSSTSLFATNPSTGAHGPYIKLSPTYWEQPVSPDYGIILEAGVWRVFELLAPASNYYFISEAQFPSGTWSHGPQGVGLGSFSAAYDTYEWPAFISFMPEELPDQAICVYDTAGTSDGRIMSTGEKIEHPGIQIRVRGIDYPVVWAKANEIALALDAQNNVEVETESGLVFLVQNISRTGAIVPLGLETNGPRRRHNFTINAITTYAQTT